VLCKEEGVVENRGVRVILVQNAEIERDAQIRTDVRTLDKAERVPFAGIPHNPLQLSPDTLAIGVRRGLDRGRPLPEKAARKSEWRFVRATKSGISSEKQWSQIKTARRRFQSAPVIADRVPRVEDVCHDMEVSV
jgi:hypothetical protein